MKKIHKIIYDIDGVTADWFMAFLEFANEKYGTNFVRSDVDSWAFDQKSPKIIEKAKKMNLPSNWFSQTYLEQINSRCFSDVPLIPGVQYSSRILASNQNYQLFVITDRVSSLDKENMTRLLTEEEKIRTKNLIMEDTLAWYAIHFGSRIFHPSRIHFTNGESKEHIAERIDSNLLIEDSYNNCKKFTAVFNNFAILLDTSYNQGPELPNVTRITAPSHYSEKEKFEYQHIKLVETLEDLAIEGII